MSHFDDESLIKLTQLCRIECTKEELVSLRTNLERILDYIDQLKEVPTEGVATCYSVSQNLTNVFRDDEEGELLSRDTFLANSPEHIGGMIRVPPVIKFE